jgi:hypothetical protein
MQLKSWCSARRWFWKMRNKGYSEPPIEFMPAGGALILSDSLTVRNHSISSAANQDT